MHKLSQYDFSFSKLPKPLVAICHLKFLGCRIHNYDTYNWRHNLIINSNILMYGVSTKQVNIPEQKVLGKLMGSAYVDKLLACCHTLALDLHPYPYICVLLPQVDYEVSAYDKQELV